MKLKENFLFSISSIYFAILGTAGVTGLSLTTFKKNWSSDYQRTNSAGIPDPDGSVDWNFK